MAEHVLVRNAEFKCGDVGVGQHAEYHTEKEDSERNGFAAQRHAKREGNYRVGDKRGHGSAECGFDFVRRLNEFDKHAFA